MEIWRLFSTFHTSNQQKLFFVTNDIGMDPISHQTKFEAKQPRSSASGGLTVYVAYVVRAARPPLASDEVAWAKTLLADYLGPYQ